MESAVQQPSSPSSPFGFRFGLSFGVRQEPALPGGEEERRDCDTGNRERRRRRRKREVYEPRISCRSRVLPPKDNAFFRPVVNKIQGSIPLRYSISRDWQRVYSTLHDGISLQTLYAKCAPYTAQKNPILLLIRDSNNATFGCYTSEPWHVHSNYYGSGETFVFSFNHHAQTIDIYQWTRANSYFQLSNSDSIALGGGGQFALFIDAMLERGSSGQSNTFNNPCLASKEQFNIVVLEAYTLVPSNRLVMNEDDE